MRPRARGDGATVENAETTCPLAFVTHPDPAWREQANSIISAALDEPDCFEQLWARRVADHRFEVCCIPFFRYDVGLGDEVETTHDGGRQYVVSRVARPSGRCTFRVRFSAGADAREEVVRRLRDLGTLMEWPSATLLAVDVPDATQAQEVADFLAKRERKEQVLSRPGVRDDTDTRRERAGRQTGRGLSDLLYVPRHLDRPTATKARDLQRDSHVTPGNAAPACPGWRPPRETPVPGAGEPPDCAGRAR